MSGFDPHSGALFKVDSIDYRKGKCVVLCLNTSKERIWLPVHVPLWFAISYSTEGSSDTRKERGSDQYGSPTAKDWILIPAGESWKVKVDLPKSRSRIGEQFVSVVVGMISSHVDFYGSRTPSQLTSHHKVAILRRNLKVKIR
jgi:hypothetical protein